MGADPSPPVVRVLTGPLPSGGCCAPAALAPGALGADKYSVTQADGADGETGAAAELTVIPTQLEEVPVRPEVAQHCRKCRTECCEHKEHSGQRGTTVISAERQ